MSVNFNPQKFVTVMDDLKEMHETSKKEGHAEKTFSLQSGEYTIKMESVPRSRNPLKSMFGLLKKTQITVTSQSGNFTTTYNRGTGIKDVEDQLNRLENRAISARSASAANATNFATTAAAPAKAETAAAAAATTTAAPATTPAAWQGLDHVAELRNQAAELISVNKDEALKLLREAAEALDSAEGQKALSDTGNIHRVTHHYQDLIGLFIESGEKAEAQKYLNQIENTWNHFKTGPMKEMALQAGGIEEDRKIEELRERIGAMD